MSNNCCSEACSSSTFCNSPHVPLTSPSGLCSTEGSYRHTPCSPTSSLGSNAPGDHRQEPCNEHMSCQRSSGGRAVCSPSTYSPVLSCSSGSVQGTSCLPATSHGTSFYRPASCRHPLSYRFPGCQSYGYQPLSYLTCGCQRLSYLSYDRQPLRNLPYGCQPSSCVSDCYRPISYTYKNFQPYCSSLSGWQYLY